MARLTSNDVAVAAATAVVAGTDVALVSTGAVRVMGYSSLGETINMYDSAVATDAATDATVFIKVDAGPATDVGNNSMWYGPGGVRFTNGLCVNAGAASLGTVFYLVDV